MRSIILRYWRKSIHRIALHKNRLIHLVRIEPRIECNAVNTFQVVHILQRTAASLISFPSIRNKVCASSIWIHIHRVHLDHFTPSMIPRTVKACPLTEPSLLVATEPSSPTLTFILWRAIPGPMISPFLRNPPFFPSMIRSGRAWFRFLVRDRRHLNEYSLFRCNY